MQLDTNRITTVGLIALIALAAIVGVGTVLAATGGTDYSAEPDLNVSLGESKGTGTVGILISPQDDITRIEATTHKNSNGDHIRLIEQSTGDIIQSHPATSGSETYIFTDLSLSQSSEYRIVSTNETSTDTGMNSAYAFPQDYGQFSVTSGYGSSGTTDTFFTWTSITAYNSSEIDSYEATETATATTTSSSTTTDSTTTETATVETAISGGGAIMPSSGPPTWLQALALAAVAMLAAVLAVRRA